MRLQLSVSLAIAAVLAAAGSARAAEYYVATTGSDSNAGTMDAPFATLQKGGEHSRCGRHRLDPWRDLQDHDARQQRRRHQLHEERHVGHRSDRVLGLPGRGTAVRFLGPADLDDRLHDGVRRERELPALQGSRDLLRPDEHVVQQRHLRERELRPRHLRAAQHAPQRRQRDLHRQQERRRSPGAQLRRARQLRSEFEPGHGAERRRLRRSLPDVG